MIEALDSLAEFLHNLAPVVEEPLRHSLYFPHGICFRSASGCWYHFTHSWNEALFGLSLIVGIDLIGWSIRKFFSRAKGAFR